MKFSVRLGLNSVFISYASMSVLYRKYLCISSCDELEVDVENLPYAVVEFLDTKAVGFTATGWLSDDKKSTIWPKRASNEKGWLKSLKLPKTAADLSRSWVKLECAVQTYAGGCMLFGALHFQWRRWN